MLVVLSVDIASYGQRYGRSGSGRDSPLRLSRSTLAQGATLWSRPPGAAVPCCFCCCVVFSVGRACLGCRSALVPFGWQLCTTVAWQARAQGLLWFSLVVRALVAGVRRRPSGGNDAPKIPGKQGPGGKEAGPSVTVLVSRGVHSIAIHLQSMCACVSGRVSD